MNLARETVVNFAGTFFKSIAGFAGTVVIARFLGAEALGMYSLALALMFWLDIPTTGLRGAILKRVSEGEERSTYFSTGILTNAVIVAIVGAGLLVARDSLTSYIGTDVAPLFVLLFGANVLFGTVITGLHAQKQVGLIGVVNAVERFARTGFQLALILGGYTVGGLFVGHVVSLLVASLFCYRFYAFGLSAPAASHLFDMYTYAKYAWATQLKGKAYSWGDTIVLGFFVNAALIGVYEVAWSLASTLVLLNKSIGKSLFPELSDLSESRDYGTIREHLNEGLTFSGLLMIPGLVGVVILGPSLLRIYSPEFTVGSGILIILIVARMVHSVGQNFYSAINALDRPDLAFRIAVPVLLSNLVLNVVLVDAVGWGGAAIATALTGVLNLGLSYGILRRIIGSLALPVLELSRQIAASVVMGIILFICQRLLWQSHYVTISLVCFGAGIYFLVLFGISPRFRKKVIQVTWSL